MGREGEQPVSDTVSSREDQAGFAPSVRPSAAAVETGVVERREEFLLNLSRTIRLGSLLEKKKTTRQSSPGDL